MVVGAQLICNAKCFPNKFAWVDFSTTQLYLQEIPPCTACNEAKYELIFEGIWSRHTHPKDFPVDEWRTQFSKLIGASHSNPNVLLPNGQPKPNGYRYMC